MSLTIAITAGGTTEKIDSVRKITNMSTGKLGANICDAILKKHGDSVQEIIYIHAKNAILPALHDKITFKSIEGVQELEEEVRATLESKKVDFFIHSMAISDFTTDYVSNSNRLANEIFNEINLLDCHEKLTPIFIEEIIKNHLNRIDSSSKISSKQNDLLIRLRPTPKIIGMIKEIQPSTKLVGFKLLNNVTEDELYSVGWNLLNKNNCDYVLANDLAKIKEGKHVGMLIHRNGDTECLVGKEAIANKLASIIHS